MDGAAAAVELLQKLVPPADAGCIQHLLTRRQKARLRTF
jgi:hypothetical protein